MGKDQEQDFTINFDFDKVLIPDTTVFQWGVKCDETNPDCKMTTNQDSGSYDDRTYKGLLGKLTLKFDKDQKDPE